MSGAPVKLDWDAPTLDDVAEFDSLDDAIAAALADLDDGGVVAIHAEDCAIDEDGDGCDCDVVEIRKGEPN